ncbi:MAG: hypothetical protein JNN09_04015 [Alphaproteobacteria bacterium]|nr:hypothetical protein [Alphaproteobacteria bacterium]
MTGEGRSPDSVKESYFFSTLSALSVFSVFSVFSVVSFLSPPYPLPRRGEGKDKETSSPLVGEDGGERDPRHSSASWNPETPDPRLEVGRG